MSSRKTKARKPASEDAGSGYKGEHLEGSRKSKIHEAYDKHNAETAWTLGRKLKLKEGTLRTWFGAWKRTDDKSKKGKAKPARKSKNVIAPAAVGDAVPVGNEAATTA